MHQKPDTISRSSFNGVCPNLGLRHRFELNASQRGEGHTEKDENSSHLFIPLSSPRVPVAHLIVMAKESYFLIVPLI